MKSKYPVVALIAASKEVVDALEHLPVAEINDAMENPTLYIHVVLAPAIAKLKAALEVIG